MNVILRLSSRACATLSIKFCKISFGNVLAVVWAGCERVSGLSKTKSVTGWYLQRYLANGLVLCIGCVFIGRAG